MNQPPDELSGVQSPSGSQPELEHPGTHGEISSEQLMGGKAEVLIRHGDELYRLRLTRNGKLILQK